MEVKIGIQMTARELVVDTDSSADEIINAVDQALADETVLTLEDRKGDVLLVPADKIAYVQLSVTAPRPIGFGG
ncbi:MAG TPA: DUF3107 domain-containing protein [Streptosporangiaceae bacterium]|jgi:hypothetical protein|nr:DUF3107 domain-containing protein [Streptosporangiaceae bacterium]